MPATCGLVSRASTGPEIGDMFGGLKKWLSRLRSDERGFTGDLFEILACPSYAGNFNLSVSRNPERRRNICESICIGSGKGLRVIEKHRKRDSVLPHEVGGVFLVIL